MRIKFKKLRFGAKLPAYAFSGDAGLDLRALEAVIIKADQRVLISTGLAMELTPGYVGLIWDKSGLAAKHGIKVMAGVIDANYRGEIKVVLFNTSGEDFYVEPDDKIAQLLIQPVVEAEILEAEEVDRSERGDGGFGSSGKK